MNILLADTIRFIHYALFVLVFFAPFLPYRYLPYFLWLMLLIFIDWNDFDGMCIFTKLEYYFRYGNWQVKSPLEGGPEFFRPILQKFGFSLTSTQADRLNNFIFLIFWAIAFLRYDAGKPT